MNADKIFGLLVVYLFQRGFHPILHIVIRTLQRFQAFDNHRIEVSHWDSEQLIGKNAACSLAAGIEH